MEKWKSRLELAANVALILCCVVVAAALIKGTFLSSKEATKTSQPAAPPSLVGTKVALEGAHWGKNQHTLVLFLKKGCRFCDESAPFYQRLVKELSASNGTQAMAVLPHTIEESRQYLNQHKIEIAEIKQSPGLAGVRGTPTVLLVDNTGKVLEEWIGKLPAQQENALIARLK